MFLSHKVSRHLKYDMDNFYEIYLPNPTKARIARLIGIVTASAMRMRIQVSYRPEYKSSDRLKPFLVKSYSASYYKIVSDGNGGLLLVYQQRSAAYSAQTDKLRLCSMYTAWFSYSAEIRFPNSYTIADMMTLDASLFGTDRREMTDNSSNGN
ncbi:unnamed protein product [Fusarium graminearum]|uniref:Uncharacterized protein n=1 Tax=Gibberella zeae TaxID=5518 RepID=A0A4E9E540_GIBZA|nr:unnamed protein product [Fusarium graminearum]CAG1966027.1 unnamed protein product [Fusarium graminearum]CAG2017289.1 unnamed protein product [Fusarium graminearum]